MGEGDSRASGDPRDSGGSHVTTHTLQMSELQAMLPKTAIATITEEDEPCCRQADCVNYRRWIIGYSATAILTRGTLALLIILSREVFYNVGPKTLEITPTTFDQRHYERIYYGVLLGALALGILFATLLMSGAIDRNICLISIGRGFLFFRVFLSVPFIITSWYLALYVVSMSYYTLIGNMMYHVIFAIFDIYTIVVCYNFISDIEERKRSQQQEIYALHAQCLAQGDVEAADTTKKMTDEERAELLQNASQGEIIVDGEPIVVTPEFKEKVMDSMTSMLDAMTPDEQAEMMDQLMDNLPDEQKVVVMNQAFDKLPPKARLDAVNDLIDRLSAEQQEAILQKMNTIAGVSQQSALPSVSQAQSGAQSAPF